MSEKKDIIVDGANIAYIEPTSDGKPKVSNLILVRQALEDKGFDPIIITDAALRYDVDDPQQLEGLIDSKKVRQAPAGTDADYFVLETAERENAYVVTNDEYRDYEERFPWIRDRRVPLMIVEGEVMLYHPNFEKDKH